MKAVLIIIYVCMGVKKFYKFMKTWIYMRVFFRLLNFACAFEDVCLIHNLTFQRTLHNSVWNKNA